MSAFEELQVKLREIFQLDRNDLDFGLYRIMNLKSQEVTQFIDNDLLPQVKDGLAKYVSNDNKSIQEELDKAIKAAKDLGVDPDTMPKVKELRAKLTSVFNAEKVENEIYSDLYNFFKRYYSEGDFMSLRRYKEGVYALPYEGEEVKLHWANADQYYVKSGDTLTNYTFKVGSSKVRFEVIQATTEQNNNKDDKNRKFKLIEENPVKQENGEYIISFSYLPETGAPKQEELNKQAADALLKNSNLMPIVGELSKLTGSEKNRMTVLLKHINNFTAKSTFDYFIHKDLGKFLNRELDFYIKNEIMHLDDIDNETEAKVEQYLGKIKVLRRVARKIIQLLSSLENFQKKIWLKKKFVLETNYCITLDRVPEELYPQIVTNEKQKEEWIKLFTINEIKEYTGKLTIDLLKNNPFLVLDTAFFDTKFKYKLLASIDDFDKQCDGLLVNSDNFQYLNLSNEKQWGNIKCIYIDPPYNTGNDGFVYKDGYSHSSWLAMMESRLKLAREYLSDDGVIFISIDDNELDNMRKMCDELFGTINFIGVMPRITKKSGKDHSATIAKNNDYLVIYSKNKELSVFQGLDADLSGFNNEDEYVAERGKYKLNQTLDYDSLWYNPTMDFPIEIDGTIFYAGGNKSAYDERHNGNHNPKDWVWRWSLAKFKFGNENGFVVIKKGKDRPRIYTKTYLNASIEKDTDGAYFIKTKTRETTVSSLTFVENQYSNDNGKKELDKLMKANYFDFPKPYTLLKDLTKLVPNNNIMLDFFAGSGTTGHAVISLNRDDDKNRKYILVEMGNYFDLVTKPRIEKVIYSEDWKNGKPVSRKGSSHCFKYIRLESYEDALDNLKMERSAQQSDLLNKPQNKEIKEEYILNYMMDLETQGSLLNVSDFEHPFDYEMKITRDGETKTVKVDLVETFNYLIGLNVESIRKSKEIVAIEGITRAGEKTLVLWRDTNVVDNQTLDNWFEKQNYSTLDMEFDTIYVNGNNNLENLRKGDETWKVRLTEAEFLKRMFDVKDV